MPGSEYTATWLVQVGGSPLPADVDVLLNTAWVDQTQHLPDQFVLRFRDPDRVVTTKGGMAIGAPVTVQVVQPDSGTPQTLMTGEVTALEVELDAEGTFTVVRGYDLTHRLRHGSRATTYLNQSYDQIVRKILQGAGLRPGTIERTSTVHAHVGQANVDDRTFCQRLAAEVGFRFGMRDGKVDFCRPTVAATAPVPGPDSPLRLVPDRNLLALRAAVSAAEQVSSVRVRGWDPVKKVEVVAEAPAAASGVHLPKSSPKALATAVGAKLPMQVAARTHRLRSTADSAAKAAADRIGACSAELEAVALGDIALHPGAVVTLDNLGDPFDGGYTVSRARHVFDPELGYTTTLSVSGAADRSLLGLTEGTGATGPASTGIVPTGIAVGIVTDNVDPQQLGRVKVKLPWLAEQYETDWAPAVQLGAGNGRGFQVLPEVGDQVLVAFEHGDPDRPYVLGGLYSTVDKAPAPVPLGKRGSEAVTERRFTSRLGHRLVFSDVMSTKESITLATAGDGCSLVLDKTGTTVKITSDGTVVIEGRRGIQITAATGDVTVKGRNIALEGQLGVKVSSPGPIKVESNATLDLVSSMTSVKGNATTTITGGIVRIN